MKNGESGRQYGLVWRLTWWSVNIAMVFLIALWVVISQGSLLVVDGRSMEPILENQDVVLIDKICYDFNSVKRFDVIAFENKKDPSLVTVKRVIGLPGETVQIKDGSIYINGVLLDTKGRIRAAVVPGLASEPVLCGQKEYFVMGAWPDVSEDSRFVTVGNVAEDQILGKVWFRLKPYSRMGHVKD